ncbi:MAG: NADH-quinone oxidoreductase subunit J, partial [Nitrospinaceae bacterium]|nr:NADH-quinone oxidoreductase subunit J [Nitrospinaceae bacterium]
MELPFFYLFSAGIIGASLLMVTRSNVIHAALLLVLTFLFLSGVFVLAGAEFLAVVQILLYAGGIMVLYLFSIMLMNVDVSVRLRQFQRQ